MADAYAAVDGHISSYDRSCRGFSKRGRLEDIVPRDHTRVPGQPRFKCTSSPDPFVTLPVRRDRRAQAATVTSVRGSGSAGTVVGEQLAPATIAHVGKSRGIVIILPFYHHPRSSPYIVRITPAIAPPGTGASVGAR